MLNQGLTAHTNPGGISVLPRSAERRAGGSPMNRLISNVEGGEAPFERRRQWGHPA